jgi:hypothetical protein
MSFQTDYNQTQQSSLITDRQEQLSFSSTSLFTGASNMNLDSTLSPETSNKSFNNYTSPILGISLQFPSEWSVIEDVTRNQVTFVSPIVSTDIIQREYSQISFIPSKNLTLDEWVNNTHYEYEQDSSYPGFTLEAVTAFGFNGHVDRTFWYSFGAEFGAENKTRDTFFIDNDKLYRIRYGPSINSEEVNYRNFLSPEAKIMLDSIVTIPTDDEKPLTDGPGALLEETQKLLLTKPDSTELQEQYYEKPQVAMSESGNIYAVWYGHNSSGNPSSWFTKSNDGGISIGDIYKLHTPDDTYDYNFAPHLAVSGNNVYVLWFSYSIPVQFTRSEDGGESFSNNIITWGDPGNSDITHGKLVAYKNNVYVLLYSEESSPHPMSLARSIDGGKSFETPVYITSNETGGGEEGEPQVAISNNGNIYVSWYDGENNDVLFTRSIDRGASFSSPLQPLGIGSCIDYQGRLSGMKLATSENNVYLACHVAGTEVYEGIVGLTYDKTYNSLFLARSIDGGKSFETPVEVASMYTAFSHDLNIVTEGSNIYMVWESDGDLYFIKSNDGGATFGTSLNLSFGDEQVRSDSLNPDLFVDGNTVFVAWQNWTDFHDPEGNYHINNEIFLIMSTNGGDVFGNAVNISKDDEDSTEPDIMVRGNTVFTIWTSEVEATKNEPSQNNIMFARTRIS